MADKDIKIDGRTHKQIRIIGISGDITKLTDKQFDYLNDVIKPEIYGRKNKRDGGMIKGFSPIARPQKFKGIF